MFLRVDLESSQGHGDGNWEWKEPRLSTAPEAGNLRSSSERPVQGVLRFPQSPRVERRCRSGCDRAWPQSRRGEGAEGVRQHRPRPAAPAGRKGAAGSSPPPPHPPTTQGHGTGASARALLRKEKFFRAYQNLPLVRALKTGRSAAGTVGLWAPRMGGRRQWGGGRCDFGVCTSARWWQGGWGSRAEAKK